MKVEKAVSGEDPVGVAIRRLNKYLSKPPLEIYISAFQYSYEHSLSF